MTRPDLDRCRHHARVFKALGHATRLFLVQELGRGERCVCDLQVLVGADISTVSKHLAVLREAGLVRDERRGNQIFYSLAAPCVLEFMSCVESLAGHRPQTIQAAPTREAGA
jgi:ArsR family transcriptional regulator